MCHGQMIVLPQRQPNRSTCDVCGQTAERVIVVKAKWKGEVRKLRVCSDHDIVAEKAAWKLRGFTR